MRKNYLSRCIFPPWKNITVIYLIKCYYEAQFHWIAQREHQFSSWNQSSFNSIIHSPCLRSFASFLLFSGVFFCLSFTSLHFLFLFRFSAEKLLVCSRRVSFPGGKELRVFLVISTFTMARWKEIVLFTDITLQISKPLHIDMDASQVRFNCLYWRSFYFWAVI